MKKIIIVSLVSLLLAACNQQNSGLADSIYSAVEDNSKDEIHLNSYTDFDWDKAFLFTPYSTTESIEEQLGTEFTGKSNIDMRDDIYLLVFLHQGKVSQYAEIKRQDSDFSIGEAKYLTPSKDVINIE